MDISQHESYHDLKNLGLFDVRSMVERDFGLVLPPTYDQKTITECMLFTSDFIPAFRSAWIQEDTEIALHAPMHMIVDLEFKQEPSFFWKLPARIPVDKIDSKHLNYQAEKLDPELAAIVASDLQPDEKYAKWSECIENIFHETLVAQNAAADKVDSLRGLSKRMRGRGVFPVLKAKQPAHSVRHGRSGDYNPPPDIFSTLSRIKTRQVRRLDSLYKKLVSRTDRRQELQTEDTSLEWKAIVKAKGYVPDFLTWVMDSSDIISLSPNFPSLAELDCIRQWTRVDADSFHQKLCYKKRKDFKTSILKDWEKGGKKTYDIVANRSITSIQSMWVPCPFDALFLRWCAKGVARLRFPADFRPMHEDEFWFGGFKLKCIHYRENHVDLTVPNDIQQAIRGWNQITVHRWIHSEPFCIRNASSIFLVLGILLVQRCCVAG